MRPQPLIAVHDVEASCRWYRQLLGRQSAHGGSSHWECRPPDLGGYPVVIASPDGTARSGLVRS